MAFRILSLEERIVLDAALAPISDNHVDGDAGADAIADDMADSSAAAWDADGGDGEDADSDEGSDSDQDGNSDLLTDGHDGLTRAMLDSAPTADDAGPIAVLVINSRLADADILADAAAADVLTVSYDSDTTSSSELAQMISTALDGRDASSIAFANHGTASGGFALASDAQVNLGELLVNEGQQDFWREIGGMVNGDGRIDLLACSQTAMSDGQLMVAQLESLTGVNVAASYNFTGNGAGGDWILESDNIDAEAVYFNSDRLDAFTGNLPSIWYVDANATGADTGVGWVNAFVNLQDALDTASSGDEIWVADGNYYPDQESFGGEHTADDRNESFVMVSGVNVFGGFSGWNGGATPGSEETSIDQRDWQANVSVLDGDLQKDDGAAFTNRGDNSYHVVTGASNVALDGFTVRGGCADGAADLGKGGGFYNSGISDLKLANLTITDNWVLNEGGGMLNQNLGTGVSVTNSIIEGNHSSSAGAGVENDNGYILFSNVIFANNDADNYGAGMRNNLGADVDVVNSLFVNNIAGLEGGAIANGDSNMVLYNCTLVNNDGGNYGGAISNWQSTVQTYNSILWGNVATTTGDEVYNNGGGTTSNTTFKNTIVDGGLSAPAVSNNGSSTFTDSGGNSSSNPRFVMSGADFIMGTGDDTTDYDGVDNKWGTADDGLRLQDTSPAISAGENSLLPTDITDSDNDGNTTEDLAVDLIGGQRVRGGTVEMGAYEAPGVLYVNDDASGGNNGGDWGNAYSDLNSALAVATADDEIWVSTGIYRPDVSAPGNRTLSFDMVDGVDMFGGFAGWETNLEQRDPLAYRTTLTGDIGTVDVITDNSYHVVTGASNAILSGFVVERGNANGAVDDGRGGGMLNTSASNLRISDVVFIDNRADFGGALYNNNGAVTVFDSDFENNQGMSDGGAVFNYIGSHNFANNFFTGNTTPGRGGAMINWSGTVRAYNNVFSGNSADKGGGVYNYFLGSTLYSNNNTYHGNTATSEGGAMYNLSSTVNISNSILWDNVSGDSQEVTNSGSTVNIYSSDIKGSGGSASWDTAIGIDQGGNLDADPLFYDADGEDNTIGTEDDLLYLTAGSPVINQGDNARTFNDAVDVDHDNDTAENVPLDGDFAPRIEGANVDMGAFEAHVPITIYVNDDAGGANDGSSWTDAYTDLQDALDMALWGDEIWVAGGTYKPDGDNPGDQFLSFEMMSGVDIYGGFAGNEAVLTDRDLAIVANKSFLSGDIDNDSSLDAENTMHVVKGDHDSRLDGFTITMGYADGVGDYAHGGGMYNVDVQGMDVVSCTFMSNQSLNGMGGGVYNTRGSQVLFSDTSFSANIALSGGAVAANDNAGFTMGGVSFSANVALAKGGAIFTDNADLEVKDSVFSGNSANNTTSEAYGGAAAHLGGGTIKYVDNIFQNNVASGVYTGSVNYNSGGSLYASSATVNVYNSIFADNRVENKATSASPVNSRGGATFGVASITNSLFYNNIDNDLKGSNTYDSNIYGNTSVEFSTLYSSTGNTGYLYEGNGTINNSILWNDTANAPISGAPSVQYSIVKGGYAGTGNQNGDPSFVDRADPDGADGIWYSADDGLRLSGGSIAVNAAGTLPIDTGDLDQDSNTSENLPVDIAGAARTQSVAADMGAYERGNSSPTDITLSTTTITENISGDTVGNLSSTDPDTGDTHSYSIITDASGNFEVVNNAGTWQLKLKDTAAADYEAQNSYSVTVRSTDTGGLTYDEALTVNVTNVNEAPTANDDNVGITEDTPRTFNVLGNDSDPEGAALTVDSTTAPTNGSVVINGDNSLTYTPDANYYGADSFTYTIKDAGGLTSTATVNLTVNPVNDAPVANNDIYNYGENAVRNEAAPGVLGNDSDIESGIAVSQVNGASGNVGNVVAGNNGGLFTVNSDGSFTFDSNSEFDGLQVGDTVLTRVQYTVRDSNGAEDNALLTVRVLGINDAPASLALDNNEVAENVTAPIVGSLSVSDADAGDSHIYEIWDGASWGTSNGIFKIAGNQLRVEDGVSFNYEVQDSYVVRLRATDSQGASTVQLLAVNVKDINEPPTDILLPDNDVLEKSLGATVGTLYAADEDTADSHTYKIWNGSAWSGDDGTFEVSGDTLKLLADVQLDYQQQQSHQVRVMATDADGLTFERFLTVQVNPVINNDPIDSGTDPIITDGGSSDTSDPVLDGNTDSGIDTGIADSGDATSSDDPLFVDDGLGGDAFSDSGTTDGAATDGAAADGAAADGAAADGAAADGAAADGAAADGAVADGAAADGAVADGAAADGAAADGAAADGAAADGAVADGAVADGAVADGAVADGTAADGAVADGAVADGVVADGAVNDANNTAGLDGGTDGADTFTGGDNNGGITGDAGTDITDGADEFGGGENPDMGGAGGDDGNNADARLLAALNERADGDGLPGDLAGRVGAQEATPSNTSRALDNMVESFRNAYSSLATLQDGSAAAPGTLMVQGMARVIDSAALSLKSELAVRELRATMPQQQPVVSEVLGRYIRAVRVSQDNLARANSELIEIAGGIRDAGVTSDRVIEDAFRSALEGMAQGNHRLNVAYRVLQAVADAARKGVSDPDALAEIAGRAHEVATQQAAQTAGRHDRLGDDAAVAAARQAAPAASSAALRQYLLNLLQGKDSESGNGSEAPTSPQGTEGSDTGDDGDGEELSQSLDGDTPASSLTEAVAALSLMSGTLGVSGVSVGSDGNSVSNDWRAGQRRSFISPSSSTSGRSEALTILAETSR